MKKQIFLLSLMLMVVTNSSAIEVEIGGLWYEVVSKTKEATVIKYKNDIKYIGDIVIPESIKYNDEEYRVTSIGSYAFESCIGLFSVIIPNSVTYVENFAFYRCSDLTLITIPNSVMAIGGYVFAYCSSLTSVTIPNSVTCLREGVFRGCSSLISITIQGSVTSIGEYAFDGCTSLLSFSIPNSVTNIDQYAFSDCSSLTSVTIPNSVTEIRKYTFYGCSGLTSATIPSSVRRIDEWGFSNCNSLTSITIPNSVTSIGWNAFADCSSLTTITIGNGVNFIWQTAFAKCPELTDVYCYAENVPYTEYNNAFDGSYIEYATLHVPIASIDAYKSTKPWSGFKTIVGLDGSIPETQKCATPTISYDKGEIVFSCETEGVEYVSEVTVPDANKYYDSKISLSQIYNVSVYAVKDGYDNSDTVTAEIHISGSLSGDTNGDGVVNAADIVEIVNIIMAAE